MPYITKKQKEKLQFDYIIPENAGELNYVITMIIQDYYVGEENYQRFNDCLGALEGAKLELYRRKISKYEDEAIEKNGDVY